DLDFMQRMLEEAGISYYFEEKDDKTVCVLHDAPQSNEKREQPIAFRDEPTVADKEHVTAVRISRQVRPGKMTMRDYDYRLPAKYDLAKSATGDAQVEEKLETFNYTPGAFLFQNDKGDDTPYADDKGKHRTDEGEAQKLTDKRLRSTRGDS